jgi:hypothetical protein
MLAGVCIRDDTFFAISATYPLLVAGYGWGNQSGWPASANSVRMPATGLGYAD